MFVADTGTIHGRSAGGKSSVIMQVRRRVLRGEKQSDSALGATPSIVELALVKR